MKRLLLSALFLTTGHAFAQLPIETDALRVPVTKTGGSVLIKNGRVLTITNGFLDGADVLIQGGKIVAIGKNITPPAGVKVIDATGKFVSPGLVDAHNHTGTDDVNEWSDSITAETRIHDVLNPNFGGVWTANASGITSGLILHGSANPIGGQSVVIKFKWKEPYENVVIKDAPRMIKFALGENPKRPGDGNRFPGSRMGVEAVIRRGFADAKDYIRQWDAYEKDPSRVPIPRRDLRLEALADILRGKIVVQCHSYRQDEMLMIAKLSKELGFKLVLQHALESYKIAPELAKMNVPVSIFSNGFAYKLEVTDSMPLATAILDKAGVLVSINTDTFNGDLPLHIDAGRTVRYGVSPDHALRMITLNPAIELGIDKHVGSLEPGKDGDVAIWSGHPLSTFSKCVMTLVDGEVRFERRDAHNIDRAASAGNDLHAQPEFKSIPDMKVGAKTSGFLIKGATVHPVNGPAIPNGEVLTDGERILAVGKNLKATAGTQVIDAKGLHVYPGFIDAGSQLGLAEIGQVPSGTDLNERGEINPDLRAITAVDPAIEQFGLNRFNGVTNALVVPQSGFIPGQAGLVHTAGLAPDDVAAEPLAALAVRVPEGPGRAALETADDRTKLLQDTGDGRRRLRKWFEASVRYRAAKLAGELTATDVKEEAMIPYLEGKKPVLFAADGVDAIRWAIRFAKEFKLRPVIMGGAESWRIAAELKEANVPVVLDAPAVASPSAVGTLDPLDPYDTVFATSAILRRAGVRIAYRTNNWDGGFDLPFMVGRACAFGLSNGDAIRALTSDAAAILGVDDRLGTLAPGRIANIVITDGDPLDQTTLTKFLLIRGRPASLQNHYTELYERYAARVR